MDNYDTLYNAFRPTSFDQVKGQDHIIGPIQHQINTNTLPHSLIFFGPPGTGKTSVARLVAKAYNDSNPGIKEIDAAQDRKVESIRKLIPTFNYAPMEGDYVTVIFDEAHQMTHDAFQALQKVVEEPPEGVRFIFVTTRIDKIPTTIVSRSQRHAFTRIPNNFIYDRLSEISKELNKTPSTEIFDYAIQVADGSLRDALVALGHIFSLESEEGLNQIDIAEALGILGGPKIANFLFLYLKRSSLKEIMEAAEMFESDRVDSYRALFDFQQYIVDSLVYLRDESCKEFLKFNVSDLIEKIDSLAATGGHDQNSIRAMVSGELETVYDLSVDAEELLSKTKNTSAAFKRFVIKLINTW